MAKNRPVHLSRAPRFPRARVALSSRPAWTPFKPAAAPLDGELVIAKRTNSAFIGTDLEARLRAAGQHILYVAGVITNNSVEATVRMAGNLGFDTYLIEDATFTFGRKDWNGVYRTADEVHAMSLVNLSGEYCTVVRTRDVLLAAQRR